MKLTATKIAFFLKKKLSGKKITINKISSLDKLKTNSLIFLDKDRINENFLNKLDKTKNLLFITSSKNKFLKNYSYIYSKNPRLDYNRVLKKISHLSISKKKFTLL